MAGKAIFVQTIARDCFCIQICFSIQTLKSLEKTEFNRIRFNSALLLSVWLKCVFFDMCVGRKVARVL